MKGLVGIVDGSEVDGAVGAEDNKVLGGTRLGSPLTPSVEGTEATTDARYCIDIDIHGDLPGTLHREAGIATPAAVAEAPYIGQEDHAGADAGGVARPVLAERLDVALSRILAYEDEVVGVVELIELARPPSVADGVHGVFALVDAPPGVAGDAA